MEFEVVNTSEPVGRAGVVAQHVVIKSGLHPDKKHMEWNRLHTDFVFALGSGREVGTFLDHSIANDPSVKKFLLAEGMTERKTGRGKNVLFGGADQLKRFLDFAFWLEFLPVYIRDKESSLPLPYKPVRLYLGLVVDPMGWYLNNLPYFWAVASLFDRAGYLELWSTCMTKAEMRQAAALFKRQIAEAPTDRPPQ